MEAFVQLLGIVGIVLLVVALMLRKKKPQPEIHEEYCTDCGAVGLPQFRRDGERWIEIALWFTMLLPGFLYSLWRTSTERWVCATCHYVSTIPLDSPKAKAAMAGRIGRTGLQA